MSNERKAMYWDVVDGGGVRCGLCPHRCTIQKGMSGLCGARENSGGELVASGYGLVSSIALDPIEKKPLYMFHPGKSVLSIGGFGCNLRCPFCQNFEISVVGEEVGRDANKRSIDGGRDGDMGRRGGSGKKGGRLLSPDNVAGLALQTVQDGNIGIAYTYNEPLIGYEFLLDCAGLVRGEGLSNVIVTNGFICKEPLEALLPLIDAMNIDLKGFSDGFYMGVNGDLDVVKNTIGLSHRFCHVEVTTLVIPNENEGDIEEIAKWLSSIDPDIPLHLSRFFPRYRYSEREPTDRNTVLSLRDTARKYLNNVFVGNM